MIHYRHFRITHNKYNAITIAIEQYANYGYKFAGALCSKKDQFNKATGRKIATERLKNSKNFIFTKDILETIPISNNVIKPEVIKNFLSSLKLSDFALEIIFIQASLKILKG